MFVLMGANGNITSKLARLLLAHGQKVRVIGRDPARMEPLADEGAELAVGSVLDPAFLARAFQGAEAIYTMIPPDYAAPDHRKYQNAVSAAIAEAIVRSGVRRVVNLSSAGASLPEGTGPIAGLHDNEQRLDRLAGIDLTHVRAGYFMENHLHAIGPIRSAGVYPAMLAPDVPIAMVATQDLATAIARELTIPSVKGRAIKHVLGPRNVTMAEAARILGAAIGKPDLKYVQADPAQAKQSMVAHGFSPNSAELFEAMSRALSDGRISATYTRDASSMSPTTLESFAQIFTQAYRAAPAH